MRPPLIERCFAWLDDALARRQRDRRCSAGATRASATCMYRDFEPVAVLDWEMAAPGRARSTSAWMVFLHRFFQDLTEQMALPGMPHFMRRDDVVATYEQASGVQRPRPDFFMLYAALRHGIIMSRIPSARSPPARAPCPTTPTT